MSLEQSDRLIQLLRLRQDRLAQLVRIGQKQAEMINQDQMTGLLDVLAAKDRLIDDLQKVQRELDPLARMQPQQRQWRSEEDRQQAAELVEHCNTLYQAVIQQEQQDMQRVQHMRDETSAQLEEASRAHQARGAYAGSNTARSSLDLSSGG